MQAKARANLKNKRAAVTPGVLFVGLFFFLIPVTATAQLPDLVAENLIVPAATVGQSVMFSGEVRNIGEEIATAGWDLSTASYDNISKDFKPQTDNPSDIAFNDSGTKMYVVDDGSETVYQYTLVAPWDLSTALYDNVSKDVVLQATSPSDIVFNDSGTRMYILDEDSATAYQYTLVAPWDLSTASYDNVSKDVVSQATQPSGIAFNDSGTRMYILDEDSATAYQYTLVAPWNLETASYDNVRKEIKSLPAELLALIFNDSGTRMYILDKDSATADQYTLAAPWDLSTALYDNISKDFGPQTDNPSDIVFNNSGTRMYMLEKGSETVYQYSISAPFASRFCVDLIGSDRSGCFDGTSGTNISGDLATGPLSAAGSSGDSETKTTNWTPTAPDDYMLYFCSDVSSSVTESDESLGTTADLGNCIEVSFTVAAAAASPLSCSGAVDVTKRAVIADDQAVRDAIVEGQRLYVNTANSSTHELAIYDITNPISPNPLGRATIVGIPTGFELSGNHIYVAAENAVSGRDALQVFDISNPGSILGGLALMSVDSLAEKDVGIWGNFVYVTTRTLVDKYEVFDTSSNQLNPSYLGEYPLNGWGDLFLVDSIAFVSGPVDPVKTFIILDISDPLNPVNLGGGSTDRPSNQIIVEDQYAYVTTAGDTLEVFDITNFALPSHKATVAISNDGRPLGGSNRSMQISGDYLVLANSTKTLSNPLGTGDDNIEVLDISDPENPVKVGGALSDLTRVSDLAFSNRHVYLTGGSGGSGSVEIFELECAPPQPDLEASLDDPGVITQGDSVTFSGDVKNAGVIGTGAAGGGFRSRFCIGGDADGCLTGGAVGVLGIIAGEQTFGGQLSAGESTTLSSNTWNAVAGTHNVYLCADIPPPADGVVDEGTNEGAASNCASRTITVNVPIPQCSDLNDNELPTPDGKIDAGDPGCYNTGSYDPNDDDESDDLPFECSNNFDDDKDGTIDHSSVNPSNPDLGCSNVTDDTEASPPGEVSIETSPRLVRQGGTTLVTWNESTSFATFDPVLGWMGGTVRFGSCTVTAEDENGSVGTVSTANTGTDEPWPPTTPPGITGTTIFTLTCKDLENKDVPATARVDVLPKLREF